MHRCDDGHVIVIEYEVHGRVVGSGAAYENRFVSIVTVANRKIVHWRDYMDSLLVSHARPLHEDLIVAARESHALGKPSHGLQSSAVYSRSTR